MTYVDWFNHRRLHGTITDDPGYTTPAAHEADHYRGLSPRGEMVPSTDPHSPGGSAHRWTVNNAPVHNS
jgi:hypothetical protein